MDAITTLVGIPAVLAAVNVMKRAGLQARFAPVGAVAVGIIFALLQGVADAAPVTPDSIGRSVVSGLVVGLAASGIYDVTPGDGLASEATPASLADVGPMKHAGQPSMPERHGRPDHDQSTEQVALIVAALTTLIQEGDIMSDLTDALQRISAGIDTLNAGQADLVARVADLEAKQAAPVDTSATEALTAQVADLQGQLADATALAQQIVAKVPADAVPAPAVDPAPVDQAAPVDQSTPTDAAPAEPAPVVDMTGAPIAG